MDFELAHQYFQEMKVIANEDGGTLWGRSLEGPMLFVDHKSRMIAANQAVEWAGVKWTMVVWPLSKDQHRRARLMVHESFHRIQDDLGLSRKNTSNRHLDTAEGRIWLQLESRALKKALRESDDARRQAVRDALIFRRYRQSLFEEAETDETELEIHEGLAEYTGVKLSGLSETERIDFAATKLTESEGKDPLTICA